MGEGTKDVKRETGRAGAANGASADTAEIRAEIEQKRAEISGTLDEIQERLTPRNLVSHATGTVRDATASGMRQVKGAASGAVNSTRQAAAKTAEQARQHPWSAAAAMAGAGAAAWWLARRPSRYGEDWNLDDYTEESLYFDDDHTLANDNGGVSPALKTGSVPVVLTGLAVGWWLWNRRANAGSPRSEEHAWNGGAYESAGADAGSYRTFDGDRRWQDDAGGAGRVRGALSEAASRAREAATAAGERTRNMAGQAQRQLTDRSRRAANQLESWVDRNPLAAGATAFLIGLVVGLAVPESEGERRLMSGPRRRLIAGARQAGREAVGRAKQTLVEAGSQRRG